MVAVHCVMFSSLGKALMPGVGFIMRSMSSFCRLNGCVSKEVGCRGSFGFLPLRDCLTGAVGAGRGVERHVGGIDVAVELLGGMRNAAVQTRGRLCAV